MIGLCKRKKKEHFDARVVHPSEKAWRIQTIDLKQNRKGKEKKKKRVTLEV